MSLVKTFKKPFTSKELEQIRYSFKRVGHKYGCDVSTVSKIANGHRNPDTELGKLIISTLRQILNVLKPIP